MDAGLDTGDIVGQAQLDLPAGMAWEEVEGRAAALGGRLLAEAAGLLAAGRMPRRPQGPGGSYRPAPRDADFVIGPSWPARRAFAFMRGTAAWGHPYALRVGAEELTLEEAIAYEAGGELGRAYRREGELVAIQMTPGVLTARGRS